MPRISSQMWMEMWAKSCDEIVETFVPVGLKGANQSFKYKA
jgi:hypothetical protein